jgi:cell division septation protein DedD
MRDLDRWKDRVELVLDGRQLFFLFFGGATFSCLLFSVGVMVGKRLEARAIALTPAAAEDPLAALDQLAEGGGVDDGLTYHRTLTGARRSGAPTRPRAGAADEAQRPAAPTASAPATSPSSAPVDGTGRPAPAQPAPLPIKTEAGTPGHFTLQLSAFPDKNDAQEFARKVEAGGFHPFIVQSDIPGRGTFYRVRVGDFANKQAAVDAKTELERRQHLTAYVAKL